MSDFKARQIERRIALEGFTPELVAALHREFQGDPGDVGDQVWVSFEERYSSNRPGRRLEAVVLWFAGLNFHEVHFATAVRVYNELHAYSQGTPVARGHMLRLLEEARNMDPVTEGGARRMLVSEALQYAAGTFYGGRRAWSVEYVRTPSDEDLYAQGSGWRRVP